MIPEGIEGVGRNRAAGTSASLVFSTEKGRIDLGRVTRKQVRKRMHKPPFHNSDDAHHETLLCFLSATAMDSGAVETRNYHPRLLSWRLRRGISPEGN